MITGRRFLLHPSRWPIRARLTALYATAFAAAGLVLVAVTYLVVSQSLTGTAPGLLSDIDVDVFTDARRDAGLSVGPEATENLRRILDEYRQHSLERVLQWSLIALGCGLVLAIAGGWVLAARALRPLQQVTDTARRVAHESLHERIAMAGPDDEIKELADTMDEMLERLDRSFDAQRSFVANASHELRTPLAVNRTLLEVALGDPAASDDLRRIGPALLATNERSHRLVEGLLVLARSEQGITDRTPLDLAQLAATAIAQHTATAARRGVSFAGDLRPAPVSGNAVLVEHLVDNLVRNAASHSSPGVARISTGRCGDVSELISANPGPAFGETEAQALLEPFRRGMQRTGHSGGAGLGLSIARSVAHAHHGTIHVQPRAEGGLTVSVELPSRNPT